MTISLSNFSGIMPALDERVLPPNAAQVAHNVDFDTGGIVPLASDVTWASLNPGITTVDIGVGKLTRLYLHRSKDNTIKLYRYAGGTYHVVQGQVNNDQFDRVYYTKAPTTTPFPQSLYVISNSNTAKVRLAGVPRPTIKLDVTPENLATPKTVSTISKGSPAQVTFSAPHGFKGGERILLSVAAATGQDATSGMLELGGKSYLIDKVSDTVVSLRNTNTTNSTALDPTQVVTATRVIASDEAENRAYVFTVVNEYGEESMPSNPSAVIEVADGAKVTVVLSGLTNNTTYADQTKVRLYRTVTGLTSLTRYLFVKEAAGIGGTITIVDDVEDVALGEQLISQDWALPPSGLRGLVGLPNGFMAGFVGNTVYLCEAYQPHAWPTGYAKTVDGNIVALGVFGSTLVVTTEKSVYLGSATDPVSMTLRRAPIDAPCVSPEMMVSAGIGVIYPSYDGLILLGADGPKNLTVGKFTKAQWRALIASPNGAGLASAMWYDGKYYAFHNSTGKSYVFHISNDMRVSTFDNARSTAIAAHGAAAGCVLSMSESGYADAMLTIGYTAGSPNGEVLGMFVHPTDYRTGVWRSKVFTFNGYPSFSALQALADYGRPNGVLRSYQDTLIVKIMPSSEGAVTWGTEVLDWTGASQYPPTAGYPGLGVANLTLSGPVPVRIPPLAASREWTVELILNPRVGNVASVVIVENMEELKN